LGEKGVSSKKLEIIGFWRACAQGAAPKRIEKTRNKRAKSTFQNYLAKKTLTLGETPVRFERRLSDA